MLGLFFGGRRRSPALFYLRMGLLAAVLIGTFVVHFSTAAMVDLRIARIVLVVLFLMGARLAGPGRRGRWQGRRSAPFDATAGDAAERANNERT